MKKREWVVEKFGNERIEIGLRDGETPDDVMSDIVRSFAFSDELRSRGTTEWRSHYRWWGPVKFMGYKEVGPPPWPFPKVFFRGKRNPTTVRFTVGWRSTLYAVVFMWAGFHTKKS